MDRADNRTPVATQPDIRQMLGIGRPGTGRRPWRRWLVWSAVLVALAAVTVLFVVRTRSTTRGVQYRSQEARRGSLTVTVTATGALEPVNQVEVGTEISGIIDMVAVNYNDRVRVGQVLAKVNTDKLKAQSAQAESSLLLSQAQLQQSQATVAESRSELERLRQVRELSGGRVPSQHEMDAAEASLKRAGASESSARAQIAEAEATLEAIKTDLRKATVRSTINGIVLDRQVDPGQTVAASFQTPTLFTLAEDLSRMRLSVDVDEADVGKVMVDQKATFTVDAYPDHTFEARVIEVRYSPKTVDGVVTYETLLSVDNSDLLLRPGMTATANIIVQWIEDAVLVPNAALRFTPPGREEEAAAAPQDENRGLLGSILPRPPSSSSSRQQTVANGRHQRVWIEQQDNPVLVEVTVGTTDGEMTEVVSGDIQPGVRVLVDVIQTEK